LGYWQSFSATDCISASQGKNEMILNHFRISAKKELSCKDTAARTSSGYQALADDIHEMRVKLAIKSRDGKHLRWLSAGLFDTLLAPDLVAIEVCLRLRAPQRFPVARLTSQDCQGNPLAHNAPAQRLIRQVMALPHRTPLLF
jgi:hypothetical protein